jgi:hypothetical protein
MIDLRPITLEGGGIRLEPLTVEHHDALVAASTDGRLWELWFTATPDPAGMRAYIADALKGQRSIRSVAKSSAFGRTTSISGRSGPSKGLAPRRTA